MCRIPSGFADSGCYPACAAVLFHLRQANDLVFQVYSPCVRSITVLQCLTAFLLLNSSRIRLAVIVLIIIQSFPDIRRNDSCGSAGSFPVSGRMRGAKRPLTHSDKRPYKLSRAWNYTPELFSLADTDPRGMNLVSRLVSRYLFIHAFLIGRAPFFKDCVDYTMI